MFFLHNAKSLEMDYFFIKYQLQNVHTELFCKNFNYNFTNISSVWYNILILTNTDWFVMLYIISCIWYILCMYIPHAYILFYKVYCFITWLILQFYYYFSKFLYHAQTGIPLNILLEYLFQNKTSKSSFASHMYLNLTANTWCALK